MALCCSSVTVQLVTHRLMPAYVCFHSAHGTTGATMA